jgi:DNA-binding MarR family transcriptional regulator
LTSYVDINRTTLVTHPDVPLETTWRVRDTCLCLAAQRAARTLARRFDDALRPFGLTNEQFSLLMTLNAAEPPTLGSAAAMLGADRTTLTAALKPLIRRGLARMKPDKEDRRRRRLGLTRAGHARLTAALPAWEAAHAALEADLAANPVHLRATLNALSLPPLHGEGQTA